MLIPRVDLYTVIHKALREAMYLTGALLERTNFADDVEREAGLGSAVRTLAFFDQHLSLEDGFIMPQLALLAPPLLERLAAQHREHDEVSANLKGLLSALEGAAGVEAVDWGLKLCKAWNGMVAEQSKHMNTEEIEANAALWAALDDARLAQLRAEIQASIPPPRFGEWLAIMLPTMNHQELVGMLTGVKITAPPEVYGRVSGLAQSLLGGRWPAVAAALAAG